MVASCLYKLLYVDKLLINNPKVKPRQIKLVLKNNNFPFDNYRNLWATTNSLVLFMC